MSGEEKGECTVEGRSRIKRRLRRDSCQMGLLEAVIRTLEKCGTKGEKNKRVRVWDTFTVKHISVDLA